MRIIATLGTLTIRANLTLKERMILAVGKGNWCREYLRESYFPAYIHNDFSVEYKLFNFRDKKTVDGIEAWGRVRAEGFHPSILPELLVLGESLPKHSGETIRVVALENVPDQGNGVPYLEGFVGKDLQLKLASWEETWLGALFLGVRYDKRTEEGFDSGQSYPIVYTPWYIELRRAKQHQNS